MSCTIATQDNRFYVAVESGFGQVPAVSAAQRFGAVKLAVREQFEALERKDKTGTRTYQGLAQTPRRRVDYELHTYLYSSTAAPAYGALFEAATGGQPAQYAGGTVQATPAATQVRLTAAHGLSVGQAVAFGGELRFVTRIVDASTIELNAPFTVQPSAGSALRGAVTYRLARSLRSVSLFDRWSPGEAVQRIVAGALVDRLQVRANSDFHEFRFAGPAAQVIDSKTFTNGQGGLGQFPAEPAVVALSGAPVPGHLGQAWLGSAPDRYLTLIDAELELKNNANLRADEFGQMTPVCFTAGQREVGLELALLADTKAATQALYQASRLRAPIPVMLQLGQQDGQLCGAYLPSVVLQPPAFEDGETRLEWRFRAARAQGTVDDELFIAFA